MDKLKLKRAGRKEVNGSMLRKTELISLLQSEKNHEGCMKNSALKSGNGFGAILH